MSDVYVLVRDVWEVESPPLRRVHMDAIPVGVYADRLDAECEMQRLEGGGISPEGEEAGFTESYRVEGVTFHG